MPRLSSITLRTSTKAILLVALTVLVFLPALQNGFIWDDDAWLMKNRTLQGITGLSSLWLDLLALQQYYPITGTAFWIEYQLWGFHPFGYHAINVVLHGLNAVLFALVLRKLRVPGAWFAAALFAVHPVMVESVAWITEIKNILSTTFFLGSVLAYLNFENLEKSDQLRHGKWFAVSLLLFVCALLTKSITCSLPVALIILIWWKRDRVRLADFRPLLPFFLVGIPIGLLTAWLEVHHVGAVGAAFDLPFYQRCIIAGRAIIFYSYKLIWPNELSFIYPRWQVSAPWLVIFPAFVALAFAVLWAIQKKVGKAPLAAAAFFVVSLSPLLGFFSGYALQFSFVADHWQYLSSLGLISLASAVPGLLPLRNRVARAALLGLPIIALSVLTWRQCFIYQNMETLWRDTLTKNPDCWLAHNNLGVYLSEGRRVSEAEQHFREAIRLRPRYFEAQNNLGEAVLARGEVEEAEKYIDLSIEINPNYSASHWDKALVLARRGQRDEAYEIVQQGLQQRPIYLGGVNNFAWLLATAADERVRDPGAAEKLAQRCCKATGYTNARFLDTLAASYASQNRFDEATATAEQAVIQASELGQPGLVHEIADRLELYKSKKSYVSS
jgi:Flp pilus assembly protein TadD